VFQAVIDTGFSDYLTLPPQAIRTLGLPEGGSMRVSLADNSETDLQVYAGTVSWDGRSRDITILAAEGVPLIGMSLLYGFELRIRTIDGGSVTITSLTGPSTP